MYIRISEKIVYQKDVRPIYLFNEQILDFFFSYKRLCALKEVDTCTVATEFSAFLTEYFPRKALEFKNHRGLVHKWNNFCNKTFFPVSLNRLKSKDLVRRNRE